MKKLIVFLSLILVSAFLFAQDSTGSGGATGFTLPSWAVTAGLIVLAVYEVAVRFFPTVKNYSVIGFIITLIQKIVPNKSVTAKKLP